MGPWSDLSNFLSNLEGSTGLIVLGVAGALLWAGLTNNVGRGLNAVLLLAFALIALSLFGNGGASGAFGGGTGVTDCEIDAEGQPTFSVANDGGDPRWASVRVTWSRFNEAPDMAIFPRMYLAPEGEIGSRAVATVPEELLKRESRIATPDWCVAEIEDGGDTG